MTPELLSLGNETVEVWISKKGRLVSILDRQTGRNYVAGTKTHRRPLCRLTCVELYNGKVLPGEYRVSSDEAEQVRVTSLDDTIRVVFERLSGREIDLICSVRLKKGTGDTVWGLKVSNRSHCVVKAVEYPILVTSTPLGEFPEEERILVPRHDGYLVGNPDVHPWVEQGRATDNQRFLYPGEGREFPRGLSAQLVAYYDSSGGILIATHDGNGHPKMLGPIRRLEGDLPVLDFTPVHILPESATADYVCSYDTIVGCFHGDWQTAADRYKEWARGMSWCKTRLSARSDIPDWLKAGAFFFNFRLRNQTNGIAYLKDVPDLVEDWGKALGVPMVAMMCGWENGGEWTGPEYFPPFGGEAFGLMCAELKRRGIRPFAFGLSGLKLTVRKRISAHSQQPELAVDYDRWEDYLTKWQRDAAKSPEGIPILDSAVEEWDGLHAYACVATEQARDQLYGATSRLVQEYGIQISQADQLFNGGTTECYDDNHGHPPGRGTWQVSALRSIYAAIRNDAKQSDPDFALSQEWQSELFLQETDLYHARNYEEPRGVEGVPLFSYLYHEYLPCYGGDWQSFLGDNSSGVYYHAANFVNGNLPAGCPQTMWKEVSNHPASDADPVILKMARNACAAFFQSTEFLILGEMLNTSEMKVPRENVEFVGIDFYGWGKGTRSVPAVLSRAWRSPQGAIAYVLANVSTHSQKASLLVESHVGVGKAQIRMSRNGGAAELLCDGVDLPHEVVINLSPQDAAVVRVVFAEGQSGTSTKFVE